MVTSKSTPFGAMFRALRVARHLSHKRAAELCELKTPTIGTIESSQYRVISTPRATFIADRVFQLAGDERARFLALNDATPLSEFSERRREQWAKRNELRGKIRNYDTMRYAACELAMRFIQESPIGDVCRCDFGGGSYGDPTKPCEICFLLKLVGVVGGLGDQERTLTRLSTIMAALEPKAFPGRKSTK